MLWLNLNQIKLYESLNIYSISYTTIIVEHYSIKQQSLCLLLLENVFKNIKTRSEYLRTILSNFREFRKLTKHRKFNGSDEKSKKL